MISEPKRPLCYSCKHRRDVPGDAHSSCAKPSRVTANPYGIKSGWFFYPFNFDPVWLTSCEGYEPKE